MQSAESDTTMLMWTLGLVLFVYVLVTVAIVALADFTSGLCGFSRHPAACASPHLPFRVLWVGAGAALLVGMLVIGLRRARGPNGMRLTAISVIASVASGTLALIIG